MSPGRSNGIGGGAAADFWRLNVWELSVEASEGRSKANTEVLSMSSVGEKRFNLDSLRQRRSVEVLYTEDSEHPDQKGVSLQRNADLLVYCLKEGYIFWLHRSRSSPNTMGQGTTGLLDHHRRGSGQLRLRP